MKTIFIILLIGAGIYYFLTHREHHESAPQTTQAAATPAPAVASSPQPASPSSNFLKRPIDRAREVTNQVQKRSEDKF